MTRRVIDHARSGRMVLDTHDATRTVARSTRARTDANSRSSVRSPELSRVRAVVTTSAPVRPKTASTVLARDTTRSGRESPRAAGCGRSRKEITVE